MKPKTVNIYWRDLSERVQKEIAEAMGIPIDQVEKETNWDLFPFDMYEVWPNNDEEEI